MEGYYIFILIGHSDIATTLNIYADMTKELKKKEFTGLDTYFKKRTMSNIAETGH